MVDDIELLYLQSAVGKSQMNNPDDVERFDAALRGIGAYAAPPEYAAGPQAMASKTAAKTWPTSNASSGR